MVCFWKSSTLDALKRSADSLKGCSCSVSAYLAYLRSQGSSTDRTARFDANYANSVHAKYKPANDAVGDAELHRRVVLGRQSNQAGVIRDGIRAKSNFMWTQTKGRGVNADKAAMTTGVKRSVVSKAMGEHFQNQWKASRGEKAMYRTMPVNEQRLLPGVVRWSQTFQNNNFGIFAYGDGDAWVDGTHGFFFEPIIHGMRIHGRNLTWGSPADRMLLAGMPWIGGVSGSIVDFYLAARVLGYGGEELADLILVDIACLVAGGQHSLGELLFGAVQADIEGGAMQFQRGGDDGFSYFATPQFRQSVDVMNKPEMEWVAARQEVTADGGLAGLYNSALEEFIRRAGPTD